MSNDHANSGSSSLHSGAIPDLQQFLRYQHRVNQNRSFLSSEVGVWKRGSLLGPDTI